MTELYLGKFYISKADIQDALNIKGDIHLEVQTPSNGIEFTVVSAEQNEKLSEMSSLEGGNARRQKLPLIRNMEENNKTWGVRVAYSIDEFECSDTQSESERKIVNSIYEKMSEALYESIDLVVDRNAEVIAMNENHVIMDYRYSINDYIDYLKKHTH